MFQSNHITDLVPIKNWITDHVQNFAYMFYNNQIGDLTPISNWNVLKDTSFSSMFVNNKTKLTIIY